MSDFNITFRGVRGSFPVANKNFYQYGGNTSCVEIKAGDKLIILDAGTGIIATGDEMVDKYITSAIDNEKRIPLKATVLLSHIHQDHIMGLTFFKPLHIKTSKITVLGNTGTDKTLAQELETLVFGKTFPIDLNDIECELNITDLTKNNKIVISDECVAKLYPMDFEPKEDDVVIEYFKSYVHPQHGVMIYKITYKNKSVVYATDKECYMGGDKKFSKFAKDCDVLIHDAQYTTEDYLNPAFPKQGFGHSTYDMAVEIKKLTNAKNMIFFHYDPGYDDVKLNRIKEHYVTDSNNTFMAYEGLVFDI